MKDELQEKVSFSMVQNMIGQTDERPAELIASSMKKTAGFEAARLSNARQDDIQVPGVEDEESVGR